jgi:hypothetical protein
MRMAIACLFFVIKALCVCECAPQRAAARVWLVVLLLLESVAMNSIILHLDVLKRKEVLR